MEESEKEKSFHIGHRARVREKAINGGLKSFHDYELLELLLFSSSARCNTRFIAMDILKKFKSLSSVFSATKSELQVVSGSGKSVIASILVVREIVSRILLDELKSAPVISNWKKLIDYLSASIGHLRREAVIILYMNKNYVLLDQETYDCGTVDQIQLHIREVVGQAIALGASAIIMVHNHPSGDVSPSENDMIVTRKLAAACSGVSIKMVDHIIVSKGKFFSFKNEGLM